MDELLDSVDGMEMLDGADGLNGVSLFESEDSLTDFDESYVEDMEDIADDIIEDAAHFDAAAAPAIKGSSSISGRAGRQQFRLNVPGGWVPVGTVKRGFSVVDKEISALTRADARNWKAIKANGRSDARARKQLVSLDRREKRTTAQIKRAMLIAKKRERQRFYISMGFAAAGTIIAVIAAAKTTAKVEE